jgi:hypothetical protein
MAEKLAANRFVAAHHVPISHFKGAQCADSASFFFLEYWGNAFEADKLTFFGALMQ